MVGCPSTAFSSTNAAVPPLVLTFMGAFRVESSTWLSQENRLFCSDHYFPVTPPSTYGIRTAGNLACTAYDFISRAQGWGFQELPAKLQAFMVAYSQGNLEECQGLLASASHYLKKSYKEASRRAIRENSLINDLINNPTDHEAFEVYYDFLQDHYMFDPKRNEMIALEIYMQGLRQEVLKEIRDRLKTEGSFEGMERITIYRPISGYMNSVLLYDGLAKPCGTVQFLDLGEMIGVEIVDALMHVEAPHLREQQWSPLISEIRRALACDDNARLYLNEDGNFLNSVTVREGENSREVKADELDELLKDSYTWQYDKARRKHLELQNKLTDQLEENMGPEVAKSLGTVWKMGFLERVYMPKATRRALSELFQSKDSMFLQRLLLVVTEGGMLEWLFEQPHVRSLASLEIHKSGLSSADREAIDNNEYFEIDPSPELPSERWISLKRKEPPYLPTSPQKTP